MKRYHPKNPILKLLLREINSYKKCYCADDYTKLSKKIEEWDNLKTEKEKLICFLDGDCLCIVNNDFVNLQESPSVFINLTKKQLKEINKLR